MDFAEAYLMTKLGHPELAGWWGKVLGGGSGGGGGGGGGGSDDDGGSKPFDQLTWDQVIASTKTGKYKSFNVGDMKELDLGSEGIVHMQIVGIDVDDLADGSGKAPLTFISKELLATSHRMNPSRTPSSAPFDQGTGSVGGWGKCEMRTYLKETIKPLIPEAVRNAIVSVTKYSRTYDMSETVVNDVTSIDDVWIPSAMEVCEESEAETVGATYSDIFESDSARIKEKQSGTAGTWPLRSAKYNSKCFGYVLPKGTVVNSNAANLGAIALGFCL